MELVTKITHIPGKGILRVQWTKGDVCVDRYYPRVQIRCLNRVGLRRMIEIDRRHAEMDIDELLYKKAKSKA